MLDDPTSDLGMHRQAMRQHGMHEVQLGLTRQLTISMKSSQGGYSANECMQLLLTHAKIKPESCFFPACRSRPEAAYDSFLTVGPTDGGTHSDDIPTMIG